MTCFLLVNQEGTIAVYIFLVMYLVVMVTQIFIFCWVGNEVIYSVKKKASKSSIFLKLMFFLQSNKLTESAYFSNFASFDRKTANALRIFMQR